MSESRSTPEMGRSAPAGSPQAGRGAADGAGSAAGPDRPERPGGMEKVFWAMLERAGPRMPHDAFVARDIWDVICDGRIGDAYVIALQYDRYQRWLERAQTAMNEGNPLRGVMDSAGCIPARPPAGGDEVEHWGDMP